MMKQLLKITCSLLLFAIVLFFIQTILLITTELPDWIGAVLSISCATCAGWYSWQLLSGKKTGIVAAILTGALILGALGFIFGFFGPMLVAQDTQQAAFIGIFVTSPIGIVLGAIGGYLLASRRKG